MERDKHARSRSHGSRRLLASYALLTMMVAQVTGFKPGMFAHTFGDLHLYSNHPEQARLQLSRKPRALPQTQINPAVRTGVRTVSRLDDINPEADEREVFICGGAQIYALALPYCSDLYLTHVAKRFSPAGCSALGP